jgi:hypothetical protein
MVVQGPPRAPPVHRHRAGPVQRPQRLALVTRRLDDGQATPKARRRRYLGFDEERGGEVAAQVVPLFATLHGLYRPDRYSVLGVGRYEGRLCIRRCLEIVLCASCAPFILFPCLYVLITFLSPSCECSRRSASILLLTGSARRPLTTSIHRVITSLQHSSRLARATTTSIINSRWTTETRSSGTSMTRRSGLFGFASRSAWRAT